MNGGSRKTNSLCCRGGRKRLSDFSLVALATFGCHIAHHGVLTTVLATVSRQYESVTASLEARKTGPDQKREKD